MIESIYLNQQLKKTNNKLKVLNKNKHSLDNEINIVKKERKLILEGLEKLKDKEIFITDHAVIRYMERVLNIDIESIKKEILSE